MSTIFDQRRERRDAIIGNYRFYSPICDVEQDANPNRQWLLVEKNDSGDIWLSTHETRMAACEASEETIWSEGTFMPIALYDLDTGDEYGPTITVDWA